MHTHCCHNNITKPFSEKKILIKENHQYTVSKELPNPCLHNKMVETELHISAVVNDFYNFIKKRIGDVSISSAATMLLEYISEFTVPYLQDVQRGNVIPDTIKPQRKTLILVSDYIIHIKTTSPERFQSFLIMLQGNMLANAILCKDLNKTNNLNNVTFYFDTPLLLAILDLTLEYKKKMVDELINLISQLKGRIAVFNHTVEEARRVINKAIDNINCVQGDIGEGINRRKLTKSDLLLLEGELSKRLEEFKFTIIPTPEYMISQLYQTDESYLRELMSNMRIQKSERAVDDDINSIRSIYALRKNCSPRKLEECIAVMVTEHIQFYKVAYEYGKTHNATKDFPSVITAFHLANLAWLKLPIESSSEVPETQLIAYAYSALKPNEDLLNKYIVEINRQSAIGDIDEEKVAILRSVSAYQSLTVLTLDDENEFSPKNLNVILEKVTDELRKEEKEKRISEENAHKQTQLILNKYRESKNAKTEKNKKTARICTNIIILILYPIAAAIIYLMLYLPYVKELPICIRVIISIAASFIPSAITIWKFKKPMYNSIFAKFEKIFNIS